jgi:hypothetical protein
MWRCTNHAIHIHFCDFNTLIATRIQKSPHLLMMWHSMLIMRMDIYQSKKLVLKFLTKPNLHTPPFHAHEQKKLNDVTLHIVWHHSWHISVTSFRLQLLFIFTKFPFFFFCLVWSRHFQKMTCLVIGIKLSSVITSFPKNLMSRRRH